MFTFKTEVFEGSIGFAVIETTDDEVIMRRADDIRVAMQVDKESKGLSMLYLAVVNIVKLRSTLILVDENEANLAKLSFEDGKMISYFAMDLGNKVSRKADFIPAITRSIKNGFTAKVENRIKKSQSDVFEIDKERDSHTPHSPDRESKKSKITWADDV